MIWKLHAATFQEKISREMRLGTLIQTCATLTRQCLSVPSVRQLVRLHINRTAAGLHRQRILPTLHAIQGIGSSFLTATRRIAMARHIAWVLLLYSSPNKPAFRFLHDAGYRARIAPPRPPLVNLVLPFATSWHCGKSHPLGATLNTSLIRQPGV